jgi:tetratricopeptide (TPR) repeat protein
MSTTSSLYERFGVLPSCTDSELRKAYCDLLFRSHPDQNPQDRDAKLKTQRLNEAYAELRDQRAQAAAGDRPIVTVSFSFSFSSAVDVQKVAGIKARLRASWDALQDQPSDPLRALQFIHAAFEAERINPDFVTRLLTDPILIDLASTLLSNAKEPERNARCATLSRWAGFLQSAGHVNDAIQILEDAVGSGLASPELKDDLRSHHYSAAQYPDPTTGAKSHPEQRIIHFLRIIELGYDLDYIYKLLAKAHHDVGDDEAARACLKHAYELNPDLSGAVRITRALGSPAKKRDMPEAAASHARLRWRQPAQIPASWQVRFWAGHGMWDAILDLSKPSDYSRRVLPAARATLRAVATSLGSCNHPAAESTLIDLLHFNYYWDVSRAAATALSKIGSKNALAALEDYAGKISSSGDEPSIRNCISYLRARIESSHTPVGGDKTALLAQAARACQKDYGLARFLLENLMKHIGPEDRDFVTTTALWARSCAEMNDFERAIEIVRPVYTALRNGGDWRTIGEIDGWLWGATGFEEYHKDLDGLYQWALELNLSLISMATTPDGVLSPLRRLTRWLETLGRRTGANFVRELIRKEAPGTWYADSHDRENYIRHTVLTDTMEDFLKTFDSRINMEVIAKLNEVMKSERWIEVGSSST